MFERDSKENIWVSANQTGAGDGSVENPFRQLKDAIEKVNSGSTVVLKEGIYNETLSLSHTKGEELKPITIMADPQSGPVIFHSEWYLYEVSDLIIDGICFENISNSAISIVGVSERNIFKNLTFTNCGIQSECTLFMGGSGGRFNIVEHCSFSCDEQLQNQIALMISQSIDSEDESIKITKNSVVRYSSFTNYGMAIIIGSGDTIDEAGNHLIEENIFTNCLEATRIKATGITVQKNIFKSAKTAISYLAGVDTDITENRFESCEKGLFCQEGDITIHENLFLESSIEADTKNREALPIIIHNNTFVFKELEESALAISGNSNFIAALSDNVLMNGTIVPHDGVATHGNISNLDNENTEQQEIIFKKADENDYTLSAVAGCHGEVCYTTEITPPPAIDLATLAHQHEHESDADIEVKGSIEERDLYLKTLYLNNQEDEKGEVIEEEEDDWPMDDEELPSQYDHYEDGLLLE